METFTNSIDPATSLRMDLVGPPPTNKTMVQGSGTIITKELELTKFMNYINECGVTSDIKSMGNKELSRYLGSYILNRTKVDGS